MLRRRKAPKTILLSRITLTIPKVKKKYDIDENTTKKVSIKLSNQITIGELKSLLLSEVTESEFFFF